MTPLARVVSCALLGLGLGGLHLVLLHYNVKRCLENRADRSALLFGVARLAVIALGWVLLARFGGAPGLLAAFLGFLVARAIVIVHFRSVS